MGQVWRRPIRRENRDGSPPSPIVRVRLRVTEFEVVQLTDERQSIPGLTIFSRLKEDKFAEDQRIVVIDNVATLADLGDWIILVNGQAASIVSQEEFDELYEPIGRESQENKG